MATREKFKVKPHHIRFLVVAVVVVIVVGVWLTYVRRVTSYSVVNQAWTNIPELRRAIPAEPAPRERTPAVPAVPRTPQAPILYSTVGDWAGHGLTIYGKNFHPTNNVVYWDGEVVELPAAIKREYSMSSEGGTQVLSKIPDDAAICSVGRVMVKTPYGASNVVTQKVFERFLGEVAMRYNPRSGSIGQTMAVEGYYQEINPTGHNLEAQLLFNQRGSDPRVFGFARLTATTDFQPGTAEPVRFSLTIPTTVERCPYPFFDSCQGRSGEVSAVQPGMYMVALISRMEDTCGDTHFRFSPVSYEGMQAATFEVLP